MNKHLQTFNERNSTFNIFSTVDPCTLITPVSRLGEEDSKGTIQEDPTYICWYFEFRRSVIN